MFYQYQEVQLIIREDLHPIPENLGEFMKLLNPKTTSIAAMLIILSGALYISIDRTKRSRAMAAGGHPSQQASAHSHRESAVYFERLGKAADEVLGSAS
jgi:hypothetical protein